MTNKISARWVLWGLVLGLSACATVQPPPAVVRPPQPTPLEQAQQRAAVGDYAGAAQRYEQLAQGASVAARAEYRLRAAEHWLQAGNPLAAEADYAATDPQALPTALRPLHLLVGAYLRLRAGDAEQALRNTEALPGADWPTPWRALRHEIRAQALVRQGQAPAAARERVAQDPYLTPEEQARNQAQLLELLVRLPLPELQALQVPPPDALGGWANLALRLRRPDALNAPEPLLAAWRREYPQVPLRQAAVTQVLAQLRQTPPEPTLVALLLPGQGRFAAEAERVRDGFMSLVLAQRLPLTVQFYSYGSPDGAEQAYQKAVAAGASWVVGPLDKEAVTRLARLPTLSVPVLALNQVPEVTPPANLYQFGLAPEDELENLAQAARKAGVVRAHILAPDTPLGERFSRALERAWANPITVYRYPAKAPKVADAVVNPAPGEAALLVADAAQAQVLLPALQGLNLPVYANAQLFEGTADGRLEGVHFCDQPWLLQAHVAPELLDMTQMRQQWPGVSFAQLRLMALGADAARLMALGPATVGTSPDSGVAGHSGRLYQDARRQIRRELSCVQFRQGWPQPPLQRTAGLR